MMAQLKFNSHKAETTAQYLAASAVNALLDEARLTPKPGLVDARGSGAHRDMDLQLMEKSAFSLEVTFYRMALAGWMRSPDKILRQQIGQIGREGERIMMQTTGGVNTHRGAIWSLGLLTTASAMHQGKCSAQPLVETAARLASIEDIACLVSFSKGRYACHRYHVPGAKGEAQRGFPHVMKALKFLRKAGEHNNSAGFDRQVARINALMAVMAELPDTCVLSRGGMGALRMMNDGAQSVLSAGGFGTFAGQHAYMQLENAMIKADVSPGGAADLLATAIFVNSITDEQGGQDGKD